MVETPRINGKRLETYNAKMLSFEVGACDYKGGYLYSPSSIFPKPIKGKVGMKEISFSLDFSGNSRRDISMNIAEFTASLMNGADLYLPDGFYYDSVYISSSAEEEKAPWIVQKSFKFLGIRHDSLITSTLTKSEAIYIEGNCETPVVLKITPSAENSTVTVNDIIIVNASGTVIVDGLKKIVTQNGQNKFSETSLTKFPSLPPGTNHIEISGASKVQLSYYPIYL